MARHYATRDFFRQMPNHLLARYFHARGVLRGLDIAAMPEPQPDALWAAWLTLDDTQRQAMDAAFQDIAALSGEKGCRAILDDAAWHFATDPVAHAAFVEQFASLAHHGARAMTTFLDHPACWRRATRFFHAEALPAWRKRTHLPHVPAAVDEASLEALAAGLSTYFRRTEGRGVNGHSKLPHLRSSKIPPPLVDHNDETSAGGHCGAGRLVGSNRGTSTSAAGPAQVAT